jgi:hypothetical protein
MEELSSGKEAALMPPKLKRLVAYVVLAPVAVLTLPFLVAFAVSYLVFITVDWALEEVS